MSEEEVVEKRRGGGKKGQVYKKRKPYPLQVCEWCELKEEVMCSSDGTAIDANTIHKMHKKQNKGELKCPDEKQFRT
jgi:hypothetical protein